MWTWILCLCCLFISLLFIFFSHAVLYFQICLLLFCMYFSLSLSQRFIPIKNPLLLLIYLLFVIHTKFVLQCFFSFLFFCLKQTGIFRLVYNYQFYEHQSAVCKVNRLVLEKLLCLVCACLLSWFKAELE